MAKIGVLIKPTPDTDARIETSGGKLSLDSLKYVASPYDVYAMEQALQLKEAGHADEVVAISFSDVKHKPAVVKMLAMGADRGIMVKAENQDHVADSFYVASVLKKVIEKEGIDLVFTGKQAIDDDNMQVPVMLSGMMNSSHVNVATEVKMDGDTLHVKREAEGGRQEEYKCKLPAVIGAHKSLNKPRKIPITNIMKAKKKPFEELSIGDLGVDATIRVKYTGFTPPPEKPAGKKLTEGSVDEMVDQLVNYLKNEVKVIGS